MTVELKKGLTPTFEGCGPYGGLGDGLLCPACGGPNLHHNKVEIFDRDTEDAGTGRRAVVENAEVRVSGDMTGNPSPRRDGLRVSFWCELCPALSEMTIVQHKGTTYVAMNVVGESPHLDWEFSEGEAV